MTECFGIRVSKVSREELFAPSRLPGCSPFRESLMARDKTLHDLFEDTLKDIYYAENKILKTLPKMAKAAQSRELKAAFTKHERETRGQVARLEKVFKLIDQKPKGKKCAAIEGILEE